MNFSPPNRTVPVPTKAKREAAFGQRVDWNKVAAKGKEPARDVVIPGVDVAALERQWGPERFGHPVKIKGDFMVPIEYGEWGPNYERVRDQALQVFVEQMGKQGLRAHVDGGQYRPHVYRGVYPAWDVRDQAWLLDRRQFIIEMYFRSERPQPIEIELDPRWVDPYVVTRGHRPARKG